MAYLDSAGNVDPTAEKTVEQWAEYRRTQEVLGTAVKVSAPVTALPSGAEKAAKGTH